MILHGESLISEDVINARFICDIEKCKGACCIEGDRGAPLEAAEIEKISEDYDQIQEYLSEDGKILISHIGFYEEDPDGGHTTTCLPDGRCSFVIKDADGILSCGIENAYRDGKTDFRKPISCHLYPIRVSQYAHYHALNYHQWDVCKAACSLGEKEGVRVYEFLKDALIRKFGEQWYTELQELAQSYLNKAD